MNDPFYFSSSHIFSPLSQLLIRELVSTMKLSISILTRPARKSMADYPPVAKAKLKELGLTDTLIGAIDAPEAVKVILCEKVCRRREV